jgi:16S rRNA processing protein RimM
MENAGRGVAELIARHKPNLRGVPVAVVAPAGAPAGTAAQVAARLDGLAGTPLDARTAPGEPEARRLLRVRFRGDEALLRVEGLTSPADVVERRGRLVRIDRAAAPALPEGEFYHYQLIGLDVVDTDGRPLGRLAEIIETGANDVYVVIGPEGERLFPAIEEVVREVDPAAGRMVVKPQEYYDSAER